MNDTTIEAETATPPPPTPAVVTPIKQDRQKALGSAVEQQKVGVPLELYERWLESSDNEVINLSTVTRFRPFFGVLAEAGEMTWQFQIYYNPTDQWITVCNGSENFIRGTMEWFKAALFRNKHHELLVFKNEDEVMAAQEAAEKQLKAEANGSAEVQPEVSGN